MLPLTLSAGAVARALGLLRSSIVKEEIDTSHRLWLNRQADFESQTLFAEIGPELDRVELLADVVA